MAFFTTNDGTRLNYASWGDGEPMVFVHGWPIPLDMWEYQIPTLVAAGFRCIAYDHRGCGHSDHPSQRYDLDSMAADLDQLLKHLALKSLALVGFSLGGGVIARYLSVFGSELVHKCVLIASSTPFLLKSSDNLEGIEAFAVFDGFIAGLAHDRPQLLTAVAPGFFGLGVAGNEVSSEMIRWIVGLCLQSSAQGMKQVHVSANSTDQRGDMAAFRMPTLVIHGDADPFQPAVFTAERTARLFRVAGSSFIRTHLTVYLSLITVNSQKTS